MERMTTTKNFGMFRKEDITYKNPRMQRQILEEAPKDILTSCEPEVPVSTTPEQVIAYFEECISMTNDRQKKHVFGQAVKWIKELEERKQKEIADVVKSFASSKSEDDNDMLDDIVAE